jgi:hypothetical protein
MAKTNISFNDKNYNIEIPSAALAALQSHFSTVMNGTGATINLGDTTYNVDSAKLTSATNDFVSHLGKISGNGYKVVVNGVEYGVDSSKVVGAVGELETVLGNLKSDDGDIEDIDVFELIQYEDGDYIYRPLYDGNELGGRTLEEAREKAKEAYPIWLGRSTWEEVLEYKGASSEEEAFELFKLTEEKFVPATQMLGWEVYINENVTDKMQETYGSVLENIYGYPVTTMSKTFFDCTNLITSPVIPDSVTTMSNTFFNCTNLTTAPVIPDSVTTMLQTFYGCTNLAAAPVIPDGVTNMTGTFAGCTNLTTAPVIPDSVTNMMGTFKGCTNLAAAPVIPDGVTNMGVTFFNCTNLTTAPVIPDGVTTMMQTFYGCTSLTTAPVIPSGVTNMMHTFYNCASLTGEIEINAANLTMHLGCFFGTTQPIVLTGTCPQLAELANGAKNGNVTVKS